jgi:hypothetical protein
MLMINQPDIQEQEPQPGKLVLPAPPTEERQMYDGGQKAQLRPEQLIRRQTQPAPKGIGARLVFYWRKDPAYKVLMIAMTMVLVAGIIFVSLASSAFLGNSSFLASTSSSQSVPKGTNPTGTIDLRPGFATPGGGSGSTQSSQPPMHQTPALQPTSTGQPSPTPGDGMLTVQFTSIPSRVTNGSNVDVGVNTSEPRVSVLLVIRYSVQGGRTTAGPQITDSNGNATIQWFVLTYGSGQKFVQAFVYAIATDQNGHQAKSQTVTVQVQTKGGG